MRGPAQAACTKVIAFPLFIALLLSLPARLGATDLSQETLRAWNEYIRGANSRMKERLTGAGNFLWIDDTPGNRERLRQGEILVEPASNNIPEKVPQGLIHDWFGAVFIPNTTIQSVFGMLGDYGRYDRYYNPAVIRGKLLDEAGATKKFSLVLAQKVPFVTAAISSEYTSQTFRLDDRHWYTVTYSTRIQQIDDYGRAGEHQLPPDQGTGYVWRLYSIQRFEEKDGGVYSELEAIALSRNVPFELQWLVRPILQHLPRNSMVATLEKTRTAVCGEENSNAVETARSQSAGCPIPSNGTSAAASPLPKPYHGSAQIPTFGLRGPN